MGKLLLSFFALDAFLLVPCSLQPKESDFISHYPCFFYLGCFEKLQSLCFRILLHHSCLINQSLKTHIRHQMSLFLESFLLRPIWARALLGTPTIPQASFRHRIDHTCYFLPTSRKAPPTYEHVSYLFCKPFTQYTVN